MNDQRDPRTVDLTQLDSGTGQTVDVSDETKVFLPNEEKELGNVLEEATVSSMKWDIGFRALMLIVVCGIFIGLRWSVMNFVHAAFLQDVASMRPVPPMAAADRLITANVVMALIGATVIQTGIGFIAITSYLFPKRVVGQDKNAGDDAAARSALDTRRHFQSAGRTLNAARRSAEGGS